MFSKTITENDDFLNMSLSTQALYFHLGIQADDDGFVSPNRIMRMIGAMIDDLNVLIAKKFVIPFENGVVVIRHWKINNYIQSDRKKDTVFLKELAKLSEDNNGVYKMDTKCIENVRLGKDSIGKDSIEKNILSSNDDFIFGDIIKKMISSKDWRMPIIANYWQYRKISFENKDQYQSGLKRELRAVSMLKGYDLERIKKTMFYLNTQSDWLNKWTLETVHKSIDNIKL